MALNVTKKVATPPAGKPLASTLPGQPSALVSALFSGVQGERLAGTDFVTLAPPPPRTVGLIFARDGHGKTTFVTDYCPPPIYLCNLDHRGEEAAYRAVSLLGREVYYLSAAIPGDILNMDSETAKQYAHETLSRLVYNYDQAAEAMRGKTGTLSIDTVTELGDLVSLAFRGRVDKHKPTKQDPGDFGASERLIRRQLWHFPNKARECRVNLIMLSRAKDVYDGPIPTGRITYDCHKVFSAACDWAIEFRKASVEDQIAQLGVQNAGQPLSTSQLMKIQKAGPRFELRVDNSKLHTEEDGAIYNETDWGGAEGVGPFAYACSKLIPRTTVEDWR